MDIRYFENGKLNFSWFGADFDHDGAMWNVGGYEYVGDSYFESDPYGDNMVRRRGRGFRFRNARFHFMTPTATASPKPLCASAPCP